MKIEAIKIFGVKINRLTNESFLELFRETIESRSKITIGYANAHTLNLCHSDKDLASLLNSMDIVHPDGIGVYLASKKLYGDSGLPARMTGSDFYPLLIQECVRKGWSIFFFGHTKSTLDKIRNASPGLKVAGTAEGYGFDSERVIGMINSAAPEILIIGLSFPLQEKWMQEYGGRINCNAILAVGDGIKVFTGEKKRGPGFIRKMGLEWLVRVAVDPYRNFSRYIVGNPRFMVRVLREKSRQIE